MKRILFICIMTVGILCGCNNTEEIVMSNETYVSTAIMAVSNKNVKNGDVVNLTTNVKAVINGKSVLFTVVYYCDDNEIGCSRDSTNNYLFEYNIKDLSAGYHKLTSKASYENDGTTSTITATNSINVIE